MEINEWIFSKVVERIENKHKLAPSVSAILDISLSNAYKRIRGEVKLTAEDLVKLLTTFDIELQEYEKYSAHMSRLMATRPAYIDSSSSLNTYLMETSKMLAQVIQLDHTLYYAARDLPLFHYFISDNLTRFKHLIWLRSADYKKHKGLRMKDISLSVLRESRQLFDHYQRLKTVELWTERTLTNQLYQLETLVSDMVLTEEEGLLILQDLEALLQELEKGCMERSRHRMILMPYLNMSNNALIKTTVQRMVFLSFSGINYVQSSNASLCSDLENWFQQQQLIGSELNLHPSLCDSLFRKYSSQLQEFRGRLESNGKTHDS